MTYTKFAAMIIGGWLALAATSASAQLPQFYTNYNNFLQAAGGVPSVIDFETTPDGLPSFPELQLTQSYNYDAQGAHFSGRLGNPFMFGNSVSGFGIATQHQSLQEWIMVDLLHPVRAVGAFFPGDTQLCIYGVDGAELRCVYVDPPVSGSFLGAVSAVPIARVRFFSGTTLEAINAFVFVPEPSSLLMLSAALAMSFSPPVRKTRSTNHARGGLSDKAS